MKVIQKRLVNVITSQTSVSYMSATAKRGALALTTRPQIPIVLSITALSADDAVYLHALSALF